MKTITSFVGLSLALLAFGQAAEPNAKDRKAMLDALRTHLKKDLRGKGVVFKVNHFRQQGNSAFFSGQFRQPNGKPFNYQGTAWQADVESGIFDDWVCALFVRSGKKWVVKASAVGATDVAWSGWWDRFGVPKSIFPAHP